MAIARPERIEEEKSALPENDPIPRLRARLEAEGVVTGEALARLEGAVHIEVESWIQFARDSEYPAPEDALLAAFA